MAQALEELIELLSIVAEEKLDSDIAQGLSEKLDWSAMPQLGAVYGNLFHYWADEDIREKDSEYQSFQNAELAKLIEHLKNKEFGRACDISFLSVTPDS